jgi:hypothetical protein
MSGTKIDLTFLKAGSTTRDEVSNKLVSIDTGTKSEDFFWGRPRISNYREIVMVGYIPIGPGDRLWGVQNLLVGYDQGGVVKNWIIVGDKRLLDQLDQLSDTTSVPLDLSSPIQVYRLVYRIRDKKGPDTGPTAVQLMLGDSSLECFGVSIPRAELRTLVLGNGNESGVLSLKMFFRHQIDFSKTPLRKKTDHVDLAVEPPTVLLLQRYLKQTQRSNSSQIRNRNAEIQDAAATPGK